jgi:hypothetical protein
VEGKPRIVVSRGVVLSEELGRTGIGLHDLMEMLRLKGISNLGQVDLVVLEPSCDVSIYRRDVPVPGLSILPPGAEAGSDRAGGTAEDMSQPLCCEGCGELREDDGRRCARAGCGATATRRRPLPKFG